jgi:hypothetical protein
MQVRLSVLAASIAQAALALAALWSPGARLSRRGGLWLFAAGCTDSWADQMCRVVND